jgi:hypothetical protein
VVGVVIFVASAVLLSVTATLRLRSPFERSTQIELALTSLGFLVTSVWKVTHNGHYGNIVMKGLLALSAMCLAAVMGVAAVRDRRLVPLAFVVVIGGIATGVISAR